MIKSIDVTYEDGLSVEREVDLPNNCPLCHVSIVPIHVYSVEDQQLTSSPNDSISSVMLCPACNGLFYSKSEYDAFGDHYVLDCFGPQTPTNTELSSEIAALSPTFVEIYHQAEAAEAYNLDQISGMGYRKALEFLIKDYACYFHPEKEKNIKKSYLSSCIQTYIEHQKLKDIAKAATWIGNDETHYIRKWEDKDITDLKRYINACVSWIVADYTASVECQAMVNGEKHSD